MHFFYTYIMTNRSKNTLHRRDQQAGGPQVGQIHRFLASLGM